MYENPRNQFEDVDMIFIFKHGNRLVKVLVRQFMNRFFDTVNSFFQIAVSFIPCFPVTEQFLLRNVPFLNGLTGDFTCNFTCSHGLGNTAARRGIDHAGRISDHHESIGHDVIERIRDRDAADYHAQWRTVRQMFPDKGVKIVRGESSAGISWVLFEISMNHIRTNRLGAADGQPDFPIFLDQ